MAERAVQQSTTPLPWWVHVCRVGWKAVRYFWAIFILTLVLPKAVDVLFSDKPLQSLPNLWPILAVIVHHPVWTLLTFIGLLLLTGLFWFGNREGISTTQVTLSEHNRTHMLRRLHLRYEQMLAQSLQGTIQIELGLASKPAAVQNAVGLSLRLPDLPEQVLPPHTSISDAYEQAEHELLILGEPGAGKSTLLLELARHLTQQAEQDTTQPLPILLPLSSWAVSHHPLQDWIVEQFALLYDVPRGLSQQWVQEQQLLLLLDGLDEMEPAAYSECIAAINTYHRQHLQPLVVCSRTNEYEMAAQPGRLNVHTAIVVQPLSKEQVNAHLESMGKAVAALRTALKKNSALQELATTPLMLQVLMLTYHGTSVRELSHKEVQLREQIWTDYVQRMVSRKGDVKRYPLNSTLTWLGWLARQMHQHNQTVFYLEQLQPDWLPKSRQAFYRWSVGLAYGLAYGLIFGLIFGLTTDLSTGLIGGLIFGLLAWLLAWLLVRLRKKEPAIEPAEALAWSWKKARYGLIFGLIFGLVAVLAGNGLIDKLLLGLAYGLIGGLFFGLLGGMVSRRQLTERLALFPNEGIRRSVKNGLIGGLIGGLFFGLIFGLIDGLGNGLSTGLRSGLFFGLFFGLVVGLILGLGAAMQHYTLRFWLSCAHPFPWKAQLFLDDATTRILLRRVGGGYSFVHRLLLDYFADLDTQASPTSTTGSPT